MLPTLPQYSFPTLNVPTAVLGSSPMTAVKQPWAWSVLRRVTIWEQPVLLELAGTPICYRLTDTRDSIAETRRMCGMRKPGWMHKISENGTCGGIAAPFLCLKLLKHTHIQIHIQRNTFKRYAGMMGKREVLPSEKMTPYGFVNCYQICEISRVRRGVKEIFALLGCYTLYVGSCMYLPTNSAQQPGSRKTSYT